MSKWNKVIIILLVLTVVTLSVLIKTKNDKADEALLRITYKSVFVNLIELERTIKIQIDNDWSNPLELKDKIEDTRQGIDYTLLTSNHLGNMLQDDRDLLERLQLKLDQLSEFLDSKSYTLSQSDIQQLIIFQEKLRLHGIGSNINHTVTLPHLMTCIENLINDDLYFLQIN